MRARVRDAPRKPVVHGAWEFADAVAFCPASGLAHREEDEVRKQAGAWGFPQVEAFDIRRGSDVDAQGHVAANDERMLVAFRGHGVPVGLRSDTGHTRLLSYTA